MALTPLRTVDAGRCSESMRGMLCLRETALAEVGGLAVGWNLESMILSNPNVWIKIPLKSTLHCRHSRGAIPCLEILEGSWSTCLSGTTTSLSSYMIYKGWTDRRMLMLDPGHIWSNAIFCAVPLHEKGFSLVLPCLGHVQTSE